MKADFLQSPRIWFQKNIHKELEKYGTSNSSNDAQVEDSRDNYHQSVIFPVTLRQLMLLFYLVEATDHSLHFENNVLIL